MSDSAEQDSTRNREDNLFRFISSNFLSLPTGARTVAYFVILLLFVHIVFSQLNGWTLVHGTISVDNRLSDKRSPPTVNSLDLKFRNSFYGINQRGEYTLPVPFPTYYQLIAEQSINKATVPIELYHKNARLYCVEVELVDTSNLRDLLIHEATGTADDECDAQVIGDSATEGFSIIDSAYASGLPNYNRLFINGFKSEGKVTKAKLSIPAINYETQLHSYSEGNRAPKNYKNLPRSQRDFYFPVPPDSTTKLGILEIEVESTGFLGFSASSEHIFEVEIPSKFGIFGELSDSGLSTLSIELLNQFDVKIFNKSDIENLTDTLSNQLEILGYNVTIMPTWLSRVSETNAIFAGQDVTAPAIGVITDILTQNSVQIKTVRPELNLRSKNPNEIQIGGSALFLNSSPLSKEELQPVINASTMAELHNALLAAIEPRVYFHCNQSCEEEKVRILSDQVAKLDRITVETPQLVDQKYTHNWVRYYRDADQPIAEKILALVKSQYPNSSISKLEGRNYNHIEVWIDQKR